MVLTVVLDILVVVLLCRVHSVVGRRDRLKRSNEGVSDLTGDSQWENLVVDLHPPKSRLGRTGFGQSSVSGVQTVLASN